MAIFDIVPILRSNTYPVDFAKQYPLTILLAEDNLINQQLMLKILEKLGYCAMIAADGKKAVEMSMNNSFDIILLMCKCRK